ncbi:hypothetical protein HY440_02840 [Candidatus Microgenomates bacterium]|nr:hypothetical protein [Candidatus Microgenomates bacterium]
MGLPCEDLALTAILFLHPEGLTRKQLAKIRDSVHASQGEHDTLIKEPKRPLDYFTPPKQSEWRGTARIAHELHLNLAPQLQNQTDHHGIPTKPIECGISSLPDKKTPYHVRIHITNRVSRPKDKKIEYPVKKGQKKPADYQPGQYLAFGEEDGLIIRKPKGVKRERIWSYDEIYHPARKADDIPTITTKEKFKYFWVHFCRANEVKRIFADEYFPSKRELYLAWPELRPEKYYDFNQPSGSTCFTLYNGTDISINSNGSWKFTDRLQWIKKGDKYYFDPENLDRIPVGYPCQEREKIEMPGAGWGYTDIVLTAEAIKHRAWKMLSTNSFFHLKQFFGAYPDSKEHHERAAWDAMTSLAAKRQGLNVTEFLRLRLEGAKLFDLEAERKRDYNPATNGR